MKRLGRSTRQRGLLPWAFRRDLLRDEYPCDDCGLSTAPVTGVDEWYTVTDDVWAEAGASEDGILCIGCLEQRLGRQLLQQDFLNAMLNRPDYGNHSDRLISRLTANSDDQSDRS